ncbi:MAG: penicillin-insensitive murein endopeptidase [Methylococcaceae bacterium]|nr:penicillin-insensitive murein endopeptidase [Methylococcaceae bacterium]
MYPPPLPSYCRLPARALASLLLVFYAAEPRASSWSERMTPTDEAARSIGQTNNGCIAGAHALPLEGPGYQVMHIERNRFYGHPQLVKTIQTLGQKADAAGLGVLQIGDLGQARGGPLPFGHRSHQTGLDVDIWFNLDPRIHAAANDLRSNINAPSMLNGAKNGLNHSLWNQNHIAMLELAASLAEVDRIFVNPYIKKALCGQAGERRSWLRKIRPWYHHDDHFHLRIACPSDSPSCEKQEAVPAGDGCDASLDWWFQPHPPTSGPAEEKPPLPQECQAILQQP